MNKQALAEDMVELWHEIKKAYVKRYSEDPTPTEHVALLEQAMKWRMTKDIQAQRSSVPSTKEKPVRPHTPESDELISDKQLKFIEDLGGTPDKTMTRKQASKYIEELKEG